MQCSIVSDKNRKKTKNMNTAGEKYLDLNSVLNPGMEKANSSVSGM